MKVGDLELSLIYSVDIPEQLAATLDFTEINSKKTRSSLKAKFLKTMSQAGYKVNEVADLKLRTRQSDVIDATTMNRSKDTAVDLEIYCFLDGAPDLNNITSIILNYTNRDGTLSFEMKPDVVSGMVLTEDDFI